MKKKIEGKNNKRRIVQNKGNDYCHYVTHIGGSLQEI